jgi:glucose-1-phosphate thymidylyltransferase
MDEIIGLVPAAGMGTRLYPYTGAKELLPIGSRKIMINGREEERPIIVSQYVVESMVKAGARKIIIIINRHKDDLMGLYKDGRQYGVDICYLFQDEPLGMAHALNLARNWVGDATVLLGMPDTVVLPDTCFIQLLERHRSFKADLTLGLFPTDKPYKFGMVEADENFEILRHEDKPKETTMTEMWGIVCWERTFTEKLAGHIEKTDAAGKEVVLGDIFDAMIGDKYVTKAVPIRDGRYYDVGTYDDFKRAVNEIR